MAAVQFSFILTKVYSRLPPRTVNIPNTPRILFLSTSDGSERRRRQQAEQAATTRPRRMMMERGLIGVVALIIDGWVTKANH